MSLPGLIRSRGSKCTVRRGAQSYAADKSAIFAWTSQSTDTSILLLNLTTQQAQMQFGRETKIAVLGFFESGADVREDDGLWITSGTESPKHFRVAKRTEWKLSPSRGIGTLAFGLEYTGETFL